jgi:ABC-type branched-subunit amino acid transport system substrate-binding protein
MGLLGCSGVGRACASPGVTANTIVLGQSIALAGPLAELGNEYRSGAQLFFDNFNERGGVHGRKVRLISRDDGYDPDLAVQNVRRLVDEEKVFAIFGQFGTGPTRAAFLASIHQGVPVFAPFTGADALRDYGNPYLFHVRASYGQELKYIVEQLLAIGVDSVAIAYQDDGFGQAAMHGAVSALTKRGVKPVVVAAMTIAPTVDVWPAVAAISAKRPAAVLLCTGGKGAVAFIRRYRETTVPCQFYATSEVGSRELARDLGSASRGIVITQVVPSPWSARIPVSLEYQHLRSNRPEVALSYGSLEGFIAAKVFAEGLRRAGKSLTRDMLVASLESMEDVDFGGFKVSYGPGNHTGSNYVELSMLSRDGEFVR